MGKTLKKTKLLTCLEITFRPVWRHLWCFPWWNHCSLKVLRRKPNKGHFISYLSIHFAYMRWRSTGWRRVKLIRSQIALICWSMILVQQWWGMSDINIMWWSWPKGKDSSWVYFIPFGLNWQPAIQPRKQFVDTLAQEVLSDWRTPSSFTHS